MLCKALIFVVVTLIVGVSTAPANLYGRLVPEDVPDYVLEYAPLVWLHSAEKYFPTDLQTFLDHVTPRVNFEEVSQAPLILDLSNLDQLKSNTFLTSNDDITSDPPWLLGTKPDSNGNTKDATSAAIIVNDKGNGNVDAFYMFFYAFNWGGEVLDQSWLQFGNHVGDWEHVMVRFSNGDPQHVWFSQHANGQAFKYGTTLKGSSSNLRPLAFSSNGSHANYAIPGTHDHTIPNFNLPGGVLEDYTNKGYLFDPLLNAYFYYLKDDGSFAAYDGTSPTSWLGYKGRWGDEEYPENDDRQVDLFGQVRYASGPTGPADKQLSREKVCPKNGNICILRSILVPKSVELDREVVEGNILV